MRQFSFLTLIAAATLPVAAFAGTYIAPGDGGTTTGYVGLQNAMVTADTGVSGDPILTFNVTGGYFASNTGNQQTYTNANVVINNLTQNNGNGAAITTFTGTVTGSGAFALTTPAGSGQDWVFSGDMTGYSGNISVVQPNTATNAGTTLGTNTLSVFQYGGTTSGGTVAQGTVTDGILNNVAGTGTISVNNLVFNYGTDASYTTLQVTNSSIATRYGLHNLGNANLEITGVISGAGALNQSGTGTLTLTGVNTYTGNTTISAGTLEIAGAGGLGSGTYAGAIANAGTLRYNGTANQTLSGVISGAGALVKDNAGTLTLSGANTYTGATTVNAGTLVFNNASAVTLSGALNGAGAVTKEGAGTLNLNGGGNYGGALTVSAGTLSIGGTLASVGSVTVAAGTTLAVSGTGALTAGTLAFEGTGTITFGTLTNYTSSSALSATTVTLGGGAGSVTINLGSGIIASDTYHLLTHNGSLADLTGFTLGTAPTLGARQSGGLVYTATGIDYVVAGDAPKWTGAQSSEWSAATIGGASNWQLITGGTATDYIAGDVVLFDDTATGTTVSIAANVSPASTIFNNAAKDYTLSGAAGIAGAGSLTKSGAGKLTISSQNTYTGGTTLNAGTLAVTDATSLGDSSGALTFAGNSTLRTLASFSTSRNYILNTGVAATIDTNGFTLTQSGVISGAGSLTKTGAGTLALSGTNTYTGGTTVNAGTLDLGAGAGGAGVIRGTVTVNTGATLQLSGGDATGYNTDASRLSVINLVGGTLNVNTTANQTLGSAVINMTGASITGIAGSNLDLFANGSAINTLASATESVISLTTMNLRQNNTTFTVADGAAARDLVISANLGNGDVGNHNLIKAGAGNMVLTGTNNGYTGTTTVSAGTLTISGTTNGTSSVIVNGGASLVVKTDGALTTTGSLSTAIATGANITVESGATLNAGSVNIAWNSSTFKVDGILTATGDFKVSTNATTAVTGAGTINAANFTTGNAGNTVFSYSAATANLSGKIMVGDAATAGYANTFSQSAGTINASGLQLGYAGTTARQTYNLTGGTLNLGSSGIASLGTGTRNINLGAGTVGAHADWSSSQAMTLTSATGTTFDTLDSVDGVTGRNVTLSGILSGATGRLVKSGAGTLTLSGANTFGGGLAVNAGTIVAGNAKALGTGALAVNAGTLEIGAGVNVISVNGITLSAGATLVFADDAGSLALNGASGYTLATGSFLDVGAFTAEGTYHLITGANGAGDALADFTNTADGLSYQLNALSTGVDLVVTAVPEPETYGLLGAGSLAALAFVRRRRRAA